MNRILNEIKEIIRQNINEYLPEVEPVDLEENGTVYYMNGKNGTEFDWYINEHLPSFMVFYNDEQNLGAVKLSIYTDGGVEVYIYGDKGNKVIKEVQTSIEVAENELFNLAVILRSEADEKNVWDASIDIINTDVEITDEEITKFRDTEQYMEELFKEEEISMNYERPYYENINYHPLMFYVIFGAKDEELEISRERHNLDEIPEGLNMNMLIREQHSEYMNNLIGGTLGKLLKEEQPELYEKIQKENIWAVVNGEITQDNNLKYMRNTIGVVQAFLDTGAIAVLDMQTFSLYSAEEFTEKIFSKNLDVYSHVKILLSNMEDGNIWLHTRGLRKFGRPDVSIENIHKSDVDKAVRVVNQMIYYSSLGVLFNKKTKLHTHKEETFIINPKFIEDYENIDFNNAYCKLLWEECDEE